jgi:hypothetical protein
MYIVEAQVKRVSEEDEPASGEVTELSTNKQHFFFLGGGEEWGPRARA